MMSTTIAFAIGADGAFGWMLLALAPIVAAGAAYWSWRHTPLRDSRTRAVIAVLRGAFVLLAMLLLADPSITRSTERLPPLQIRWSRGAATDIADAPGGATRRESLASALDRARSLGLDRRFELIDGENAAEGPDAPVAARTLLMAPDAETAGHWPADGRVFAILPPRDPEVPDLSVLSVVLPARASTGSPVEAVATIRSRGAAGRRIVVTVSDGARVAQSASHEVVGSDETFTVALGAVLQRIGWQRVSIEVAGVTGEVSLADNRLDRWIELEPGSRSVLFVESAPSWEGKFVRRALEKDATMRVDYATSVSKEAVVDVRTAEGESTATGSAARAAKPAAGPASLQAILGDEKRLFGYDAVVIGPLDGAALSDAVAEKLVRFVDARGGGLVVLGGNAYAGSVLASRGPLAKLLPAEIPARSLNRAAGTSADAQGSVVLAPADGFAGHPAFAMLGEDPRSVLGKLQKLGNAYLKVGPLAPGAEAIATDGASKGGEPLVVSHRYGAGRVTLVASPDTWRLSVGATAELEDVSAKFWTGLVGWTAGGVREGVRVWSEPTVVADGAPARLILEARGADWTPLTGAVIECRAELEPVTDGGTAADVRFVADVAAPGRYVATVTLPGPGTWLVTADLDGRRTATGRVEVRSRDEGVARPDPSIEAAVETELKERGGGLIRDGDAEALLESLGSPEVATVTRTTRPARGVWWAFVLPLLFAAEAFLRRRSGLDATDEHDVKV